MVKRLCLFLMFVFPLLASADSGADERRDVLGLWQTEEKDNTVLISEDENGLPVKGILAQSKSRPEKEGEMLLSDFSSHEDGWSVTLYSPKRDKYFDAVIYRTGQELHIEVDVMFFTHRVVWAALR